ncbi:hypothetical protein GSI_09812 [Ganoderma sinense ZZ0214-1]|uniref:Uncharacterized protein n=1 Tax=Ganoderma sinense ZZ0214-1 TaxID=1077348 RepID=A0A2G8S2Q8_9APHY|nr:hypothetical protein GSI_09812 [Ganoderma sinense ZZ0214-1]
MAQATGRQCSAPSANFNEDLYLMYFQRLEERFASVGLLGGLYGLLTILSVWSLYALTQRGGGVQPTAIVLSLTILALLASTTIYMIISILSWQTDFATIFMWAGRLLWNYDEDIDFRMPFQNLIGGISEPLQACAGTAALTINVILSDTIVCWRACVVWQNNRIVWAVCGVFLLATFVLGVIDTAFGCNMSLHWSQPLANIPIPGAMYKGFSAGIAACVLSLSTNLLATLLVGWKAWESRTRLRGYFVGGSITSQIEKLFALLIESGAIYCAFWIRIAIVVAFQLGMELPGRRASQTKDTFVRVVGVFLDAGLVPLIAIYPTIIIVFVALHRSHIEEVLTHNQSIPTPHLSLALRTEASRHSDGEDQPQEFEFGVSVMDRQDIYKYSDSPGDVDARTGEELTSKVGVII